MDAIRQLLVHYGDSGPATGRSLDLAAGLAHRLGASLRLRAAIDSMAAGAYLSPESAALATQLSAELMQNLEAQARQALQGLPAGLDSELVLGHEGAVEHLVEASRGGDLLVLTQPEAGVGLGIDALGRILVQASCPVLVVPHIGCTAEPGRSILLAWSGTRESARALNDALPWLRAAAQVELLALAESEPLGWSAAQAHLRRHGVQAQACLLPPTRAPSLGERLVRAWSPDATVAETLLSHAADSGADLIVCGAYGHPRAWELVLGGVTRSLLQSMTVPVLFSH